MKDKHKRKRKNEPFSQDQTPAINTVSVTLAWLGWHLAVFTVLGCSLLYLNQLITVQGLNSPSRFWVFILLMIVIASIVGVIIGAVQKIVLNQALNWEASHWIKATAVGIVLAVCILIPLGAYTNEWLIRLLFFIIMTLPQSFALRDALHKPWFWTVGHLTLCGGAAAVMMVYWWVVYGIIQPEGMEIFVYVPFFSWIGFGTMFVLSPILLAHLFKHYRQYPNQLEKSDKPQVINTFSVFIAWISVYVVGFAWLLLMNMVDLNGAEETMWGFRLLSAMVFTLILVIGQVIVLNQFLYWKAPHWFKATVLGTVLYLGLLMSVGAYIHEWLHLFLYVVLVSVLQSFVLRDILRQSWLWTIGHLVIFGIIFAIIMLYKVITMLIVRPEDTAIAIYQAYVPSIMIVLVLVLSPILLAHLFKHYRQDVPELSKAKREAAA